jgi:hypothetical protein
MVTNFLKTRKYRQVLGEYERWFAGMAAAAADREIPLQLCMAMPSDAILAAKADWATNARASDDYALPSNLPSFGGGALLLWAVWKSNLQPDFNVRVCDRFDAKLSAVLRELDESNRSVQKSAESTSI